MKIEIFGPINAAIFTYPSKEYSEIKRSLSERMRYLDYHSSYAMVYSGPIAEAPEELPEAKEHANPGDTYMIAYKPDWDYFKAKLKSIIDSCDDTDVNVNIHDLKYIQAKIKMIVDPDNEENEPTSTIFPISGKDLRRRLLSIIYKNLRP
ncbi:MAG: hypothetical protein V4456_11540 [Bacteroidota bacterium]